MAFSKVEFNGNVTYIPSQSKRQSRKRRISPLYGTNVETKVGKIFMRLAGTHFLRYHKYHGLFNRNNIK